MDPLTSKVLNIQIVSMRKEVRQATVHRIHGLSQKARMLRLKKGTDEQKEQNNNKADQLVSEIKIVKKFKPDEVSLFALSNPSEADLKILLAKPVITEEAKAMAKLCLRDNMRQCVSEFIAKYQESMDLLNDLISERYSNIGKEKKKKKKLRGKKKKPENKGAETNNDENNIVEKRKTDSKKVETNKAGNKNAKANKVENKNINTSKVVLKKNTKDRSDSDYDSPDSAPSSDESSETIISIDENNPSSDGESPRECDRVEDSTDDNENQSDDEREKNSDDDDDDDDGENNSDDETEGISDDDVSDSENFNDSKKSYKSNIFKPNQKPKQNTNLKMSKISNMSSKAQAERKKVDPFFKTANDSEYLTHCDISNKVVEDDRNSQSDVNDTPDRSNRDSYGKGFRENRPFKKDFNNRKPFDRNTNNRQPYNRNSFNRQPYNRNSNEQQPFKRKFSGENPFRKGFNDSKFPKRNFQDRNQRNQNDRSNNFKNNDRKRPESSAEANVKLHPSWEAKKKLKQAPTAFQGKKIVFDD